MARTRYYRNRKRRAFSKREAKAIKSIAQTPNETKAVFDYTDPGNRYLPGTAVGSITAFPFASGRYLINIFGRINREANIPVAGSKVAVSGDEFMSIGVKVKYFWEYAGTRNYRFRISLISSDNKAISSPSISGDNTIGATNYDWMKESTIYSQPTIQPFNPNTVRILKQRTYTSVEDGATSRYGTFWCPIKGRKKIMKEVGEAGDRDYVNALAGRNYYLMFEWYTPVLGTYTPSTSDYMRGFLEWTMYFKDS